MKIAELRMQQKDVLFIRTQLKDVVFVDDIDSLQNNLA